MKDDMEFGVQAEALGSEAEVRETGALSGRSPAQHCLARLCGGWMVCANDKLRAGLSRAGYATVATDGRHVPPDVELEALVDEYAGASLLWPDPSAEGYAHMRQVGARLQKLGSAVCVVQWVPDETLNVPPAEGDWLKAIMALHDRVFNSAVPFDRWRDTSCTPALAGEAGSGWTTAATLRHTIAQTTWLWEHWVPRGVLTVLAGDPDCGKSTLALWLAHTYVEGLPWPDGAAPADDGLTPQDRFVVWVETEDGQAAMSDRMDRWNMRRSQVLLSGSDGLGRLDLGRAPDVEQIATVAQRVGAGLIVVDTLAGAHATDENSAALRELLKPLSGIAQGLNVPIVVCHHLRKKGLLERAEVTMDRLRGTSAISAQARSIITLDKPAGDQAPRRLAVIKGNLTAQRPRLGMELTATAPRFVAAPEPRQAPGSVAVSAVQQAMDFLQGLPPEGRLFAELRAEAEACGISKNALYQAAEELGLVRTKQGRTSTWKPAPVGQEGTES